MKPNWLNDARLIPDEVMSHLRKIAVHAVVEKATVPKVSLIYWVLVIAAFMIG